MKTSREHRLFCGYPPGEPEEGEKPMISSVIQIEVDDHTVVNISVETDLERSPEIVEERLNGGLELADPSVYSDIRPPSFEEVSECLRLFFSKYHSDMKKGKIRGITREL